MNFWNKIKKPIMILAPMADVTDASFRRVIAKYGKPDVMWTEFVSADGLVKAPTEGKNKLLRDLVYDESERPIVAQFFGSNTETMYEAGRLAVRLGFDGADINMGCPDKSIIKQGAGAALIKNTQLAKDLIRALRAGAEEECKIIGKEMIGISIKTRVGFNKVEIEEWIPKLLDENLDALIIHCRTMKEMSKVPAKWEHVKEVVEMRGNKKTLIIGNGDVLNIEDAKLKIDQTGADGAMLGRSIFGNPWLFSERFITDEERLNVMLEHTRLFGEILGDIKNFAIMKKHYKAYANGFDGAKELREKLMQTESYNDVENVVNVWKSNRA